MRAPRFGQPPDAPGKRGGARVTGAPGPLPAALVLSCALGFCALGARGQAPFISLTTTSPTVDQDGTAVLTATVVATAGNPAPPCYVPPQQPGSPGPFACNWTWTVSGLGAVTGYATDGGSSTGIFGTGYQAGTATVTVSRYGVQSASLQLTINPLRIQLSGQQQIPQGESATFTATLSGIAPILDNTDVVWSLSGGGTLFPFSNCSTCSSQMAEVVGGSTAGTYSLTAQSTKEPAVSTSLPLTVLPPPQASISPATAATGAGQAVGFTVGVINTSDTNLVATTDDPDGSFALITAASATFVHGAGKPGGLFHATVISDKGGTPATASITVVSVLLSPTSVVVPPGSSRQFLAEVTGSQQATQWSTSVPGATISGSGLLSVPVGTAGGTYAVSAQTAGSPAAQATATVTVAGAIPVTGVVVSPAKSVLASGQQEPFTAVVEGQNAEPHPNQAVTWSVTGPAATSIAANGRWMAPPTPGVYAVTATAQADATRSGTASITVGEDLVVLPTSANLSAGAVQAFQAQVSGVANPVVTWSVKEGTAGGAISTAGVYTAPAAAGMYHIVAVSTTGGGVVEGIATVVVGADPEVSISISPTEIVVIAGSTQQFAATVLGAADAGVSWSASAGGIDAGGLFTAPASYGTVAITATSLANPSVQATATAVVSSSAPGQAFLYDANGNLLSDGTRTFEWDAENRVTAINAGTHRSEFGYDGLGRRVMIVEMDNGTVTSKRHYVWVANEIVDERDATATSATIPTSLAASPGTAASPAGGGPLGGSPHAASIAEPMPMAAGDNAAFVAQSVPAAMTAGGIYQVSITMANDGTTTWTAAGSYRLGSSDPRDNGTWGMGRVYLASGDAIAPGQSKTFIFNVTAPAAAGTYNFQWQLLQEGVAWFGGTTPNLSVSVAAGATANLAQFIAQSVPGTMAAGGVYTVSITMQNAGTNVWTPSSNHHLGSQNPQDNVTWGPNRVFLSAGDAIAQGQQKTFTFTITAPATAGTYNFQRRMVQEGVAWFGDLTPNVAVTVTAAPNSQLAQFLAQSVPEVMSIGVSYQVSVTMENAGTATWTAASGDRLGSSDPQNNFTWGPERVYLGSGESIAQGQQKTFSFTVTAPGVAGTYNFQWQMVQEGVAWFGDVTPTLQVSVVVPVEPVLTRFFPGGMQSGGVNYYFSYDHLGSVREVTDAGGNVVSRYDYDPYGRLTINQGTPPRFGFAGYYYHSPSGLSLTEYREYDPDLGRWESRDPMGRSSANNLYDYVENDPVDLVDPLGLHWIYNQSTGQLQWISFAPDLESPPRDIGNATSDLPTPRDVDYGYSGKGEGLNNPDWQDVPNQGPIPAGQYRFGKPNNRKGPLTLPLTPHPSNDMFDRNAFLMHGDNGCACHSASSGCVIMQKITRRWIASSGDRQLIVVP